MAELDMEHYDDEEATTGGRIFGSGNPGMALYRRAAPAWRPLQSDMLRLFQRNTSVCAWRVRTLLGVLRQTNRSVKMTDPAMPEASTT